MIAYFADRTTAASTHVRTWVDTVLDALLNARLFMHLVLALHLAWEAWQMTGSGDLFATDPRQYAWMIRTGGEAFWLPFLGCGAGLGLATIGFQARSVRAVGAVGMGIVEYSLRHYLTASGAAPTAGPTYSILTLIALWLAFAHWLPDRRPRWP
jgi:hypothetical protein